MASAILLNTVCGAVVVAVAVDVIGVGNETGGVNVYATVASKRKRHKQANNKRLRVVAMVMKDIIHGFRLPKEDPQHTTHRPHDFCEKRGFLHEIRHLYIL